MSEDRQNQNDQTPPHEHPTPGSVDATTISPASLCPDKDTRTWAMACHLGGLGGFIIPLVFWLIKKDDHPFIDEHGTESLNFQISTAIYRVACIPLCFIGIGFLLLAAVMVFSLVCIIIAALKSNNGEHFKYPLCLRLII